MKVEKGTALLGNLTRKDKQLWRRGWKKSGSLRVLKYRHGGLLAVTPQPQIQQTMVKLSWSSIGLGLGQLNYTRVRLKWSVWARVEIMQTCAKKKIVFS